LGILSTNANSICSFLQKREQKKKKKKKKGKKKEILAALKLLWVGENHHRHRLTLKNLFNIIVLIITSFQEEWKITVKIPVQKTCRKDI
jgi:hypothetical protein